MSVYVAVGDVGVVDAWLCWSHEGVNSCGYHFAVDKATAALRQNRWQGEGPHVKGQLLKNLVPVTQIEAQMSDTALNPISPESQGYIITRHRQLSVRIPMFSSSHQSVSTTKSLCKMKRSWHTKPLTDESPWVFFWVVTLALGSGGLCVESKCVHVKKAQPLHSLLQMKAYCI